MPANKEYLKTPMEEVRIQRIGRIVSWHVRGTALEVGCGLGEMTRMLAQHCVKLYALDDDQDCVDACARNVPGVKTILSGMENTSFPDRVFDAAVAVNVLEHVEDPELAMQEMRRILKPGGSMAVSVPNAYSIHRRAGVANGTLKDVHELGPTDLKVGHKRVYDLDSVMDLMRTHFTTAHVVGSYYKPFPNAVLEHLYTVYPAATDALLSLPVEPKDAADIIVVGTR